MYPARIPRRWAALSTLTASFLVFGGCGDTPGSRLDEAIVEPAEPLPAEDAADAGAEPTGATPADPSS